MKEMAIAYFLGNVTMTLFYFISKKVYYKKTYASYCTECDELNGMDSKKQVAQTCSYCGEGYCATHIESTTIPRKLFRKYQNVEYR